MTLSIPLHRVSRLRKSVAVHLYPLHSFIAWTGTSLLFFSFTLYLEQYKGKAVPLQACSCPEGSRELRFPDFTTTAQNGGKVASLRHRPPLPPGNTPGTHFCSKLTRPQGHSATGRIMSLKDSNDNIGNRTRDLPVCSVVP